MTYTYDSSGIVVESSNSIHRKVTYDAWGRAVKTQVLDGKNTVVDQAEYRYDALGPTVREMFRYQVGQPLLELYYDASGHVIQENKLTVDWGQTMRHWRDNVYSPVDGRRGERDGSRFPASWRRMTPLPFIRPGSIPTPVVDDPVNVSAPEEPIWAGGGKRGREEGTIQFA